MNDIDKMARVLSQKISFTISSFFFVCFFLFGDSGIFCKLSEVFDLLSWGTCIGRIVGAEFPPLTGLFRLARFH